MINMLVSRSLYIIIICSCSVVCFAQNADEDAGKKDIRGTFTGSMLIESPTIVSSFKNAWEFDIQHRFSSMQNGISDLYGIYGAANTRLALNYGLSDKIMIGFGTTMYNKLQDINWKIALLKQNCSGSIPVSVSYYGNVVIDARDKAFFHQYPVIDLFIGFPI